MAAIVELNQMCDVEQTLRVEAELLGQQECLGHNDHGDAKDHIVADLCRLSVAGRAGMHDHLAHPLQHGPRPRESRIGPADHYRCELDISAGRFYVATHVVEFASPEIGQD